MDNIIQTIRSGQIMSVLLATLNQQVEKLAVEKERLLMEQRQVKEVLVMTEHSFDPEAFRQILQNFTALAKEATPEELQRMLRLSVKKITWAPKPESETEETWLHHVDFFLPASNSATKADIEAWFESKGCYGCPHHAYVEPVFGGGFTFDMVCSEDGAIDQERTLFSFSASS